LTTPDPCLSKNPFSLLLLVTFQSTFSQSDRKKSWRLSPLPVVYYSPETKFGFGVLMGANKMLGDDSFNDWFVSAIIFHLYTQQTTLEEFIRLVTNEFLTTGCITLSFRNSTTDIRLKIISCRDDTTPTRETTYRPSRIEEVAYKRELIYNREGQTTKVVSESQILILISIL
jgi:hypothetical protein